MLAFPSVLFSSTQRYRPVLAALREAGVDVDGALEKLGFTEQQLLDPDTRVPRERVVALTKLFISLSPRQDLGVLAAQRFQLSDVGVLGYLLRHSEHALGALERLSRFSRLLADAASCRLVVERGEVIVTLGLLSERALTTAGVDFSVGMVVRAVEETSSSRARPLSVDLARPRPARIAETYRALFGPVIRFDAPAIVLRFDEEAMRVQNPQGDPQLVRVLEDHARFLLSRWPEPSPFLEQLRSLLEQQIALGEPSAACVAEQLGMSERSLRRKLAQLGSSYRRALDDVRRERALALMSAGQLSITSIAHRVGFSDATAFTRTFRRWTGHPPSALARTRAAE